MIRIKIIRQSKNAYDLILPHEVCVMILRPSLEMRVDNTGVSSYSQWSDHPRKTMSVSLTTFGEFDRKGSPLATDDNGVHGPFFTNPPYVALNFDHKKHPVNRFAAAVNYATVVDGYLCISRQACRHPSWK